MARFFPYDEITTCSRMPSEDTQWLAGQIANLQPFSAGTAVLCGSVAWGNQSWRSDIDIAHFSTITYPHIEKTVDDLVRRYLDRTMHRFISPRVDVITIGAESLTLVTESEAVSVSPSSALPPTGLDRVSDVFQETAVLFADHIGSLARLKGEPWRTFLERYLSPVIVGRQGRRDGIKDYVEKITTQWARQPLHPLDAGSYGRFTTKQLDLISRTENFPKNLMRRILGELGTYPRPDRADDVRIAFSALKEPWAKNLMVLFEPFFDIDRKYENIVAACREPKNPLTESGYYKQVRSLFIDLPFLEIQNNIWQYLGI